MSIIDLRVQVPTSTNALVELMNMVERWRQRTDYGPVVVVRQDGISRYSAAAQTTALSSLSAKMASPGTTALSDSLLDETVTI